MRYYPKVEPFGWYETLFRQESPLQNDGITNEDSHNEAKTEGLGEILRLLRVRFWVEGMSRLSVFHLEECIEEHTKTQSEMQILWISIS